MARVYQSRVLRLWELGWVGLVRLKKMLFIYSEVEIPIRDLGALLIITSTVFIDFFFCLFFSFLKTLCFIVVFRVWLFN